MFSITIAADEKSLVRSLNYLDTDLKKRILDALRNSAKGVAGGARRKLRAGKRARKAFSEEVPQSQTGELARSIGYGRIKRQLAYTVTAEFYGRFLEFGTAERFVAFKSGRASRGSLSARPFFLPSSGEAAAFEKAIADAVEASLRTFATR